MIRHIQHIRNKLLKHSFVLCQHNQVRPAYFAKTTAVVHHGREKFSVVKADLSQFVAVVFPHKNFLYPRVPPAEHIDAPRRVRVHPHLVADDPAEAGYPFPQIHPVPVQVDRVLA